MSTTSIIEALDHQGRRVRSWRKSGRSRAALRRIMTGLILECSTDPRITELRCGLTSINLKFLVVLR